MKGGGEMGNYNFWRIESEQDHMKLFLDLGPEAKQNVLKQEVIEELEEILKKIQPKILILVSAKPNSFCAGADVEQIKKFLDRPEELKSFLIRMRQLLLKIHNAPYPIVAAISGECLGGGLELVLACHARVAARHPRTSLGLPEVGLGIIPGFGGTQLLPKLVGVRKALEIIVGRKTVNADEAFKIGLTNAVSDQEHLLETAVNLATQLKSGKPLKNLRKKTLIERIPFFGRKMILSGAKKMALRTTKGVYPAPLLAIKSIANSNQPLEKGLEQESELFLKVAATLEAKSLINIFFLQKEARSRKWIEVSPQPTPKKVGVVGAGIMGRSIAYALLSRNIPVHLHDSFSKAVHDAIIFIESTLSKGVKYGKLTLCQAVKQRELLSTSYGEDFQGFAGTDFVIEAIIEDVQAKHKLLVNLENISSPETVIATNTSSILPSEIGSALKKRDRFCAVHFFNPAHKMDLVEIAGTAETTPETLGKAIALTKAMGKTPIVLDKECPGLLVNRVMVQYLIQSLATVARNEASPWILDETFERMGMVMGPFKTLDLIGLDTGAHVMRVMQKYYPELPDMSGINFLQHKDLFGQKTGKGFYVWKNEKPIAPNKEILKRFGWEFNAMALVEGIALLAADSIVKNMRDEAEKIFSDQVCTNKGMIDLALILGGGILPNRCGLLNS